MKVPDKLKVKNRSKREDKHICLDGARYVVPAGKTRVLPPEVALVGQSAEIGGECNEEATFVLHFAVRVPEEGDGKIYISRKALVPQVMAGGGPGSAASDVSVESVGAQAAGGEFVVSSGEEATFTVRVLISVDRLTLAWVQIPELVFRRSRFEEEHSIPVQELKSSILGVDPDC